MLDFLNLIINENIKILKKKTTLIFIILCIIILILSIFYTKIIIKNNYGDFDTEYYKNNNILKLKLAEINNSINKAKKSDNIEDKKNLNKLNTMSYYYNYAINNNIELYNSRGLTQDYWKLDLINKLIELKTEYDNLNIEKLEIDKAKKISEKINELTQILETENFDKYIDFKKVEYQQKYESHEIDIYVRDCYIYLEEINREYSITKYNDEMSLWKYNSMSIIQKAKINLIKNSEKLSIEQKNKLNQEIEIEEYKLQNNIVTNNINLENYIDLYLEITEKVLSAILALYIIINAGSIISDDFNKRTIKQSLMTPIKKSKLLFSKFLSLTFILIVSSVIISIISQLIGNLFFELHDASSYIGYFNNQIFIINSTLYNILRYLLIDVKILLYMFFAIMVSCTTLNTSFSIGFTLVFYILDSVFSNLINNYFTGEFVKFIPWNNFNLIDRMFNNSYSHLPNLWNNENIAINNLSLQFSVTYIMLTLFIIILITNKSFKKKQLI